MHHPKYYQARDDKVPPPGDWEDPVPTTFLAVDPGTEFAFAVAPRRPDDTDLARRAAEWLKAALADWGAGAKTAAGYGRIEAREIAQPLASPQRKRFECVLELVTPAFLAGALQQRDDCDLRGATLRGQLRWWWRTMHAGHLDPRVAASARNRNLGRCRRRERSPALARTGPAARSGTVPGRGRARVSGLRHARSSPPSKARRQQVACRDLASAAEFRRDPKSEKPDASITRDTVLQQACVALWLLTRYGGVGAKGRKGFGSLVDVSIDGVSALDDCKRLAAALRAELQLGSAKGDRRVPWLERMRHTEIPLEDLTDRWRTSPPPTATSSNR